MTQWWNEEKDVEPITLIDCNGLLVTGRKTMERDRYNAVCLGIAKKKKQDLTDLAELVKKRVNFELVKEFPFEQPEEFTGEIGSKVEVDVFATGDKVKVTGLNKGKGTQGVVKRHHFAGGPKSHGHRHVLRSAGSIGSAFPEHVMKGKKMAGRMGNEQVTMKNLKIAWVDKDKSLIAIKGSVPGRKGSWLKIVSKS